jgi:hypothetical protein
MSKITTNIIFIAFATTGFAQQFTTGVTALSARTGTLSAIRFQTVPNAECTVTPENATPSRTFTVYADDAGTVQFHARPSRTATAAIRLDVSCSGETGSTTHVLEVTPSTDVSAGKLFLRTPGQVQPKVVTRVALGTEATQLSQEELLQRGYPLRPDSQTAPAAFSAWMKAVSQPATYVPERTVLHSDRVHGVRQLANGTATSNNWSGFAAHRQWIFTGRLTPPFARLTAPFDWVTGLWYIPSVTGEENVQDYSSFWIGLDGDGTSDVIQDGTSQDVFTFDFLFGSWTFTNYYPWTEWFPLGEQQISNFTVNPGDEIFSEVWVGNAGSAPTPTGAFGICLFEDLSTSTYTMVYIPVPSGVTFIGDSAEWIMERPTVNNSLPDLSNYVLAGMHDAYARRSDGSYVTYNGGNNNQISMFNGSDELSTVYPNGTSMLFVWENFK